jgi:hypothetical protein
VLRQDTTDPGCHRKKTEILVTSIDTELGQPGLVPVLEPQVPETTLPLLISRHAAFLHE